MNWIGSGFIVLLNYGIFSNPNNPSQPLITESTNLDILAEDGDQLLTE